MTNLKLRTSVGIATAGAIGLMLLVGSSGAAHAQSPEKSTPEHEKADHEERLRRADDTVKHLQPDAPPYLRHSLHSAMQAPELPQPTKRMKVTPHPVGGKYACAKDFVYSDGKIPAVVPKRESDRDHAGCEGTFQPGGPTTTATNAFFQSLGTNGRTCATCHQPPNGMSISANNVWERYLATGGTDSIFAPVDGANCPSNNPAPPGPAFIAAHSLVLKRGVFRIHISPPETATFTIKILSDPYGCNTTAPWDTDTIDGITVPQYSMYRRPRISANLKFVTAFDPLPAPNDGPAIMWDTREPSLAHQAVSATELHALMPAPGPSPAQVAEMVAFENGIYSAQSYDTAAHHLDAAGATGGAEILSTAPPLQPPLTAPGPAFVEYDLWSGLHGTALKNARNAIAHGEALFNGLPNGTQPAVTFTISNVAGVNDIVIPPSTVPNNNFTGRSCAGCHDQQHAGNNLLGNTAVIDIGVGGTSAAQGGPPPSLKLPIFEITCTGGHTTSFHGAQVRTNDPGVALISGRCEDIGKFSVPQLRALSSRAPYFSDGSAATLRDVVHFYVKRFKIPYTPKDIDDLVAFLNTL